MGLASMLHFDDFNIAVCIIDRVERDKVHAECGWSSASSAKANFTASLSMPEIDRSVAVALR
ncbi:MAG: hypothetical protein H0T80_18980 [Betaproteobacteria bacterium]|nr:hypothetical protein [Betaproteobacteria bacterium]